MVDDRAIGFASTGPARDDDLAAGTAELYAIYVDPTAWRHGAGRALVEATVEHWRERGSPPLVLWVFEANARGRAFYEALGWRADGERRELAIGGRLPVEVRYRLEP